MSSNVSIPRGDVLAKLNFFKAPQDGSNAVNINVSHGLPERGYTDDTRQMVDPDRDGVALVQALPPSTERDFVDDDSLFLKLICASRKVVFFDHNIRRVNKEAARNPVTRVHIDLTATSVIQRVRKHLPEGADTLLKGRYRIINIWMPFNNGPVESCSLAFAPSPSVADEDIVPIHHKYHNGYTGQTAGVKFNGRQTWSYLSGMTSDEGFLLHCCDGHGLNAEGARGARLAHTAFEDPRSRPDAVQRDSIEVRALVFGQ
ncbi:methyltransferase [Fusarium venenatum]|uniref:methyltransferase n=1 Tax=Fusarium venenatum TaxID=56646 RepID=UPI001DCBFE18|nr:methyltransferase [Fusarium venenatum]